jgi:hypothetical protein
MAVDAAASKFECEGDSRAKVAKQIGTGGVVIEADW